MNMEYLLALLILCVLFFIGIYYMKYIRNVKLFNLLFIAIVYIPYLFFVVYVYKTDDDPARWDFLNTLPIANISPFMFSIMPLLLLLPKNIKRYVYLLIALLSVGMFLSTVVACIGNAIRNYRFHIHFLLDYISHFALSMFGVFLIRTRQVNFNINNSIISGAILICVITLMLIINLIFDTAFFGLSLNGKHSIYNIVLVKNSYLSALIYYFGVIVILFLGFILCKVLNKKNFEILKK